MNIIINGASRGIGQDIYNCLWKNHTIIGTARLPRAQPHSVDSRDRFQVDQFFQSDLVKGLDTIDILINCAGIIHVDRIEIQQDLQGVIQTNIFGYWNFIQNVLPIMQAQKHGYIINISSIRSTIPGEGKSAYSMTKAAVDALTRSINLENFERYGIRATSICPDTVDTDMGRKLSPGEKLINPKNIAKTVEWLLSLDENVLIPEVTMLRRYPVV